MTTSKLLFRGAGLRVVNLIVTLACSFFLAPFVIHSLGDRWYGLWVLIGTFISFYGLLDFGLSGATQRYLAHAMPRNDHDELNTIIAASLVMFSGIALVAFMITVGLVAFAPVFISHPENLKVFREVTFIMGTSFAISLPFYTQFGILTANFRFDYSSYIQISKALVRTALFFLFLEWGYGIVALAIISICVDLAGYVALLLVARHLAPWMRLRRRHFSLSKMRELLGFGFFAFISKVSGKIRFEIDNVVIAGSLGLAPVTHFNIATKLNGYFFSALDGMVLAPTSLYARYLGEGKHQQIRDKFIIFSRIKSVLGIFGIGAVLIFARPFISLWVGPQYLDAFLPLVIIMVARIPSLGQSTATGAIYALGKPQFLAYINLGEAIANLALSLLLVRWYGIVGVALGTAIPLAVNCLTIQPVYTCRIVGLPIWTFVRKTLPILIAGAAAQLPLAYAMTKVELTAYWEIAAWAICYYGPLLVLFYLIMLSSEERQLFADALPSFQPVLSLLYRSPHRASSNGNS